MTKTVWPDTLQAVRDLFFEVAPDVQQVRYLDEQTDLNEPTLHFFRGETTTGIIERVDEISVVFYSLGSAAEDDLRFFCDQITAEDGAETPTCYLDSVEVLEHAKEIPFPASDTIAAARAVIEVTVRPDDTFSTE